MRLGVEKGIAAPPSFKVSARCAAPVCGINTALPMPLIRAERSRVIALHETACRCCRPGARIAGHHAMAARSDRRLRAAGTGFPIRLACPVATNSRPSCRVRPGIHRTARPDPRWLVGAVDVGTIRHEGTAAAVVSSIMPAQVAIKDESTAIPARNLAVVIVIRCPVWPRPHHPHVTAFPSGQRRDKPERRKPSRSTSNRHSRDAARPTRLLTPAASPQTCRVLTPSNRDRSEREIPFSP